MVLDKALQIKPQDIMDRLGGLPEKNPLFGFGRQGVGCGC